MNDRVGRGRQSGSTLVELLIYISLLPVLFMVLFSFIQVSFRQYNEICAAASLDHAACQTLRLIRNDLKSADAATIVIGADQIDFHSRGYAVTYFRGMLGGLYRDLHNGAGAQPVIDSGGVVLQNLQFAYHEENHNTVDIFMVFLDRSTQQTYTLQTSVHVDH